MPLDERFRFDNDERILPCEEARQRNHRQARRGRDPRRPHVPFLKQGKLLAEKQILGYERSARETRQTKHFDQDRILHFAEFLENPFVVDISQPEANSSQLVQFLANIADEAQNLGIGINQRRPDHDDAP